MTSYEQSALDQCRSHLDLIEPNADYVNGGKYARPDAGDARGKSYLAASALAEFLGGPKNGYCIMKASNHLGDHFWVANRLGGILDPTKSQFDLMNERPPYRFGQKVSKRNTLKKHLPVVDAIREGMADVRVAQKKNVDLVGRPLVVEKNTVLTDEQAALLKRAYGSLVADWAGMPMDMIRCTFTKGAMAVHFVKALLYGDEIPRYATMAYTWDRYFVAGSALPFNEMLECAVGDPDPERRAAIVRGVAFQMNGEVSFTKLISGNIPLLGYRIPFDFPISLAKELINKYCPRGGRVLDPCHGWGGRMVGFMLSNADYYVGVDPAPHSPKLQEMFDDLSPYLFEPKRIKLINKPFEDTGLRSDYYDFALTSPPYFDTEKYKGEESSWRRYDTLDKWVDGFYRPMIGGVADALKSGAYFALQVTPRFKMADIAREVGATVGLKFDKVFDTRMRRYNTTDRDKVGATELFEIVAIFRKQ